MCETVSQKDQMTLPRYLEFNTELYTFKILQEIFKIFSLGALRNAEITTGTQSYCING